VIGLGQVDELEIKRERAGQQDGAIRWQRVDQFKRGGALACGLLFITAGFGVAAPGRALAKRFHVVV